eukprot:scaffold1390_cov249-Pinguiococcus_pyrenoidosus.AAC.18
MRHVVQVAEVDQVVSDLKVQREAIQQRAEIRFALTESLHESHGQPEKSARLVVDHVQVGLLRGNLQRIPPQDVLAVQAGQLDATKADLLPVSTHQALSIVQVQQLLDCYVHCPWILEPVDPFQGQEVHVVGAVERLRNAKDAVGHRLSASQLAVVLNVVH